MAVKAGFKFFAEILVAGVLLAAGCTSGSLSRTGSKADVFVDPDASRITRVAVITFKAPTELIGKSVADFFVTDILRTGQYELVERNEIAAVLGETELALGGLVESRVVMAAGKAGAEAVIFGTVDEYTNEAMKGRTHAVAAVSVRMVDCSTGRVLWGASLAERASDAGVTLPEHGRHVVRSLTAALYGEWKKFYRQRKMSASPRYPLKAPDGDIEPIEIAGVSSDGLREVRIAWGSVPDGTQEVNVQRSVSRDGPYEDLGSTGADRGVFVDSDSRILKDDTEYFYAVTASYSDGLPVSPSALVCGKTAPPPGPPVRITASAPEARVVRLEWDAPASEGVTEYAVFLNTGDGPVELGHTKDMSFTDRGSRRRPLADSTRYSYSVRSINRVGAQSGLSDETAVITRPPPAAVSGLRMNGELVRAVDLQWDRAVEEDVVKYNIYRAVAADAQFSPVASVRGRECTAYLDGRKEPGSLEDNAVYWYAVSAVNGVGAEGERCAPAMCRTRRPVSAPGGFTAQGGLARSVLLKWNRVADEKLGGYKIRRKNTGENSWTDVCSIGTDREEYVDSGGKTGLEDGSEYVYQVAACDIGGYSGDWSDAVSAVTKAAPSVPDGVNAESGLAGKVRITWDEVPEQDIAKYAIEVDSGKRGFAEAGEVEDFGFSDMVFEHEGLEPGRMYSYRIRSVDVSGLCSGWSEVKSAVTRPVPPVPAGIEVVFVAGEKMIKWIQPDHVLPLKYKLWRKKLFSWEEHAVVDACSYRVTAEDEAEGLRLAVSAFDEDGLESARSADVASASQ